MSIATILIVAVLAFLAWKVLSGVIKIGAIILLVVAGIWVLQGGLG